MDASIPHERPLLLTSLLLVRRVGPFILVHLGALAILLTGGTLFDWIMLPILGYCRGLVIAIGYHRYFSHRSFKTSRVMQFLLAFLCCGNVQNGPIWWAAHHRKHHRHSDAAEDVHSPHHGFFWGYCGWLFGTLDEPDWDSVRDLRQYPELVWLERFWVLAPLSLAALCYWIGGWSFVCVGFFGSAVLSFHVTFIINSVGHTFGSQRYDTGDHSRNSMLLAVLSVGEGWHNNHHHYPAAAQAGFFWWELDASFRLIRLFERLGLVWAVRRVPAERLYTKMHAPPVALEATEVKEAVAAEIKV